jgi:hypothetical protein
VRSADTLEVTSSGGFVLDLGSLKDNMQHLPRFASISSAAGRQSRFGVSSLKLRQSAPIFGGPDARLEGRCADVNQTNDTCIG